MQAPEVRRLDEDGLEVPFRAQPADFCDQA
jgi:hypothetical protein